MNKVNQKKGYALLFTVVMVSIISLLAVGLSNTTFKQLVLSLGSKDSQSAFFQSDMAVECALYIETNDIYKNSNNFNCGIGVDGKAYTLEKIASASDTHSYQTKYTTTQKDSDPCFKIEIIKTNLGENTQIFARGYNICSKTNLRAVERTIEINY